MRWLLWTQLALVLAALCVGVVAMVTSRYGAVVFGAMGALPLLLLVGIVLGLIALKRGHSFIPAGIALLAPAVWLLASWIMEPTYDEVATDFVGLETAGGGFAYAPLGEFEGMKRQLDALLAQMTWSWWLLLAAAALGAVTAVLLFRRRRVA